MDATKPELTATAQDVSDLKLRYFTVAQLLRLEDILDDVGEYGELRLIVEKKRVKFAQVVKSRRL